MEYKFPISFDMAVRRFSSSRSPTALLIRRHSRKVAFVAEAAPRNRLLLAHYYKALVEAGVYVGGDALEVPEMGTTVRLRDGKRRLQDGPYADTKEQLAGFIILELPSVDAALEWAARCLGAALGAVEVRPLSPEAKRRGFTGE